MSEADRTHWDLCWRDPAHTGCAVAEVERLTALVVVARTYARGCAQHYACDSCREVAEVLTPSQEADRG